MRHMRFMLRVLRPQQSPEAVQGLPVLRGLHLLFVLLITKSSLCVYVDPRVLGGVRITMWTSAHHSVVMLCT